MALSDSDLFVVQSGSTNKSLKFSTLKAAIGSAAPIRYKGNDLAFTLSGDTPQNPQAGDLYRNKPGSGNGTFQWTQGASGDDANPPVTELSTAIYNGTDWDVSTPDSGDVGVVSVTGEAPIQTVVGSTASNVVLGIRDAAAGVTGAVALATDADLTNESTSVAVTAAQLQAVDAKVDAAAAGGVTNIAADLPISVITDGTTVNNQTTSSTTPGLKIAAATTQNTGTVKISDSNTKDETEAGATATTPAYVEAFYLTNDFSSLQELT